MPLVQPYLEWEIQFNEKYLKGSLQPFVMYAEFWNICVQRQVKITVNQLRALAAGKEHLHPDDNAIRLGQREPGTSRGDLFVFAEVADEPGDSVIPQPVAIYYVGVKVRELGDKSLVKGRVDGGLPFDQIKERFPELFDEAKIQTLEEYKAIFPD